MKVALVTTFYPPYNFGGDGLYVQRFARELVRHGCEVHVLHDTDGYRALNSGAVSTPVTDGTDGVQVHRLTSRFGLLGTLLTHQTGRPIAHGSSLKAILEDGFDVIHYHNVSLIGGLGVLRHGTGIKFYTAHEHWLVCPTHVLWRHGRELCSGRECIKCQLHYKRPPQLWRTDRFQRSCYANVDTFFALSEFSAEMHRRFGFTESMEVFPSFVPDIEEGRTSHLPDSLCKENPPYVLFVGRIEHIKGLHTVLPYFGADASVDLLVAGEGSDLEGLKATLQPGHRVRFLGQVGAHDLRQLYANSLAVLAPSLCYEVFPLVVLEAFRSGAPVIAANRGPYPEIVAKSQAGFTFDDPSQIVDLVKRLLSDTAFRQRIGENARNAYEKYWSPSVSMRAYFSKVEEVAEQRKLDTLQLESRKMRLALE